MYYCVRVQNALIQLLWLFERRVRISFPSCRIPKKYVFPMFLPRNSRIFFLVKIKWIWPRPSDVQRHWRFSASTPRVYGGF